MRLSLRNKLLVSFGVVLSVTLSTGLVLLFLARSNEHSARNLATENVPSVRLANNLERQAFKMSVSLRDYAHNDAETFLTTSLNYLAELRQSLDAGSRLSAGSAELTSLRTAVGEMGSAVEQYQKLIERRRDLTRELAAEVALAEKTGSNLVDRFSAFLTTQQSAKVGS